MKDISEAKIWETMQTVEDPELGIDVVNLGLVYNIQVRTPKVHLLMTLTTMGCPAQDIIEADTIRAIESLDSKLEVTIEWTFNPPWTPSRLTEEGRDDLISMGFL